MDKHENVTQEIAFKNGTATYVKTVEFIYYE
jgi:hypothetical protein